MDSSPWSLLQMYIRSSNNCFLAQERTRFFTLSSFLLPLQAVLHCHHARESVRIADLVAILDSKTGVVTKKKPRCLIANQSALIEVRRKATMTTLLGVMLCPRRQRELSSCSWSDRQWWTHAYFTVCLIKPLMKLLPLSQSRSLE